MSLAAAVFFSVIVTAVAIRLVYWKPSLDYIVFGQDVILTCYVCSGCCNNTSKMWVGGQNYRVLCLDEKSSYPDKYKMAVNENNLHFNLTIVKFNYTDANYTYTCACGFEQYTSTIPMEENKFIYPPGLDTIEDYSYLLDTKLTVNVTIPRIYPIPICEIKINGKPVHNITIMTEVMSDGMIQKVTIIYYMTVVKNSCSHLTLGCRLLAYNYNVLDKSYGECLTTTTEYCCTMEIGAGCIGAAFLIVALLAICLIKKWKEERTLLNCIQTKQTTNKTVNSLTTMMNDDILRRNDLFNGEDLHPDHPEENIYLFEMVTENRNRFDAEIGLVPST